MNPEHLAHFNLPAYRVFESVPSTNDVALAWAKEQAPDGALVIANAQTAGRGRMDRHWFTPPDCALAFSLILRPTSQESENVALFSPLGGLALSLALETRYQLQPRIKWPNDVLLNRKKTAGILAETIWQAGQPQAIILGIGVNVGKDCVPPADQVLFPATSIEEALNSKVERWELLEAILHNLFAWRKQLTSPAFLDAWQNRLAFLGEQVYILQPQQEKIRGTVMGLTTSGDLSLLLHNGEIHNFAAGDIHLRLVDKIR